MYACLDHQGIEPGSPHLSRDQEDMIRQARDFVDHELESPHTEDDIKKAIVDIDRRRAAIQTTGNDPGQEFPPFGTQYRSRAPRRGAIRGGRGRQPRRFSTRKAMPSRTGKPGGVPDRPERTVHAIQVDLTNETDSWTINDENWMNYEL